MFDRTKRKSRLVPLVDTEAIKPLLEAVYLATYGEPIADLIVEPMVFVEALDADMRLDWAIIGTEGVGWFTDDGNTLPFSCRNGGRSMHTFTINLYHGLVPTKGEVNLAEHVRTFGDRLDSNWSLWDGRIAQAEKKKAGTR